MLSRRARAAALIEICFDESEFHAISSKPASVSTRISASVTSSSRTQVARYLTGLASASYEDAIGGNAIASCVTVAG